MNENKPYSKVITVKDLWNVLRGCFMFVILAAVLCTGAGYIWGKLHYSPRYSSMATILLVGENDGEGFDMNQFANDYNVAYRIIDECVIMLKSRTVLDAVGEEVGIANGYGSLSGAIVIENPEDTRLIRITATASTPELAKQIVDSVCNQGAAAVNDMYGIEDLVRTFEKGTLNTWPVNAIGIFSYAKYGIIAAILVYIVFFAMFLFDNYIHTEEDIESYLGAKVIGDIPDANAPDKRKKQYTNYKSYKPGEKPYLPSQNNNSDKKDN